MTVETFSYISALNPSWPLFDDFMYEGDDHVRGIKTTLQTQFPNLNAAVNCTPAELNLLVGWTYRGTAASKDVGATAGNVVELSDVGGTPGLPAVDGSQLTGVATTSTLVADIQIMNTQHARVKMLFYGLM